MHNTVYLASRYSRRREMVTYAKDLERMGYRTVSTWVFNPREELHKTILGDPDRCQEIAEEDIDDLDRAEIVVVFLEPNKATPASGGKHFEAGYAYGHFKHLITVGPLENLFYALPDIERYQTWEQAKEALRARLEPVSVVRGVRPSQPGGVRGIGRILRQLVGQREVPPAPGHGLREDA